MKNFDKSFLKESVSLIAGVDEAGRGPLAGPVVAAAVVFDNDTFIEDVNDSKKLNEATRERLYVEIIDKALSYGVGIVDHIEIDRINILNAALLAMKNAVDKLRIKPDLILIDGNKTFLSKTPTIPIVKGDEKSFAISAASIIAKVTRDRLMKEAALKYPEYSWETNKGYATKAHIEAIKKVGYCDFHRKTFLKNIVLSEEYNLELEIKNK